VSATTGRPDDLGPVVELRITVELRRWQALEALNLLEQGSDYAAAAVLARHAVAAHRRAAGGQALLCYGAVIVTALQGDGVAWRADSVIDDLDGPVIDLVHPTRTTADLRRAVDAAPAPPPSRWMAAFTRPRDHSPC
jgi:hypothetical protein